MATSGKDKPLLSTTGCAGSLTGRRPTFSLRSVKAGLSPPATTARTGPGKPATPPGTSTASPGSITGFWPSAITARVWKVWLAPSGRRLFPARQIPFTQPPAAPAHDRSEEHTSELQSLTNLVCRLLLEKKKKIKKNNNTKN